MKDKRDWEGFEMIDKYFPKGDKRRGDALVVNAESYLLGKEAGKEEERERILKEYIDNYREKELGCACDLILQDICKKTSLNEEGIKNEKI